MKGSDREVRKEKVYRKDLIRILSSTVKVTKDTKDEKLKTIIVSNGFSESLIILQSWIFLSPREQDNYSLVPIISVSLNTLNTYSWGQRTQTQIVGCVLEKENGVTKITGGLVVDRSGVD